jgi:hypothetical protein
LIHLEPDAPAAAFLDIALFGHRFPEGQDALSDWMFVALEENAATFGNRLGRILYDLDALRSLRPKDEAAHPLDERLVRMVKEKPNRAASFAGVRTPAAAKRPWRRRKRRWICSENDSVFHAEARVPRQHGFEPNIHWSRTVSKLCHRSAAPARFFSHQKIDQSYLTREKPLSSAL